MARNRDAIPTFLTLWGVPDLAVARAKGGNGMRWLVRDQVKQFLFWLWCLGWLLLVIMSLLPEQELPFGLSDKAIHFARAMRQ